MRTTLDIPDDIIQEAMRLAGTRSKTSTIILSLQELIGRRKLENLRRMRGRVDLDIDLEALRRDRTVS